MIGVKADTGIVQLYQRNGQFLPDSRVSTSDLCKEVPKSHPHAESMMLYAQDAAECEEPWLRWEYKSKEWASPKPRVNCWTPMAQAGGAFYEHLEYRRKPQSEWPPEAC